MDLLKKVELLLTAKTRSALPRRERRGPLDEEEARVLAEIREALGQVAAKERELAERIKTERTQAEAAHQRGDIDEHLTHTRRAAELEHHLTQESTLAINLEEKLAALEEKLALAQEAVEREARKVAQREAAADEVLDQAAVGGSQESTSPPRQESPAPPQERSSQPDAVDLGARKSRLSD